MVEKQGFRTKQLQFPPSFCVPGQVTQAVQTDLLSAVNDSHNGIYVSIRTTPIAQGHCSWTLGDKQWMSL